MKKERSLALPSQVRRGHEWWEVSSIRGAYTPLVCKCITSSYMHTLMDYTPYI